MSCKYHFFGSTLSIVDKQHSKVYNPKINGSTIWAKVNNHSRQGGLPTSEKLIRLLVDNVICMRAHITVVKILAELYCH